MERDAANAEALRANTTALHTTAGGLLWTGLDGCHPVLFRAGRSLGETGLVGAAVHHFTDLRAFALQRLGSDDRHTLTTRHDLAFWRGQAGDATGAAGALEAVLTDPLRVLGPDHLNTLTTRTNLAYWRGKTGDPAGTLAAYEALLADMVRVLGPDHGEIDNPWPPCLVAGEGRRTGRRRSRVRSPCCRSSADAGRGPPHTLTTRDNLAYCNDEAGRG